MVLRRTGGSGGSAPGREASGGEFEALFETLHRPLFRLALLLTAGERGPAEDAVAEAFARTYPKWCAGAVGDPPAYLRQAVVNQLRTAIRRRQLERRRRTHETALDTGGRDTDAVADRDMIWRALQSLSHQQRTVVVLRYYDDLSEEETARTLGVPVGTVKSQTSRGLERLRGLIGGARD